MKKLFAAMLLGLTLFGASGCRSRTEYGECIGIQEDENTNLHYRVSTRNVILGVVFFETIFAPAVWLLADFKCPTGPRSR